VTEDRSILSRPAPTPDLQVRYGGHPDQVGDVFLPSPLAAPATLVLAWHGGFWEQRYDRSHLAPIARALAEAGQVVVSVEYRRVDRDDGGDGWQATLDDVAAACEQLPRLIADAVPLAVATHADGEPRTLVIGHSAGGQLALWAATSCPPRGLVAAVALAPVADLAMAWQLGLGDGAVTAWLGGGPADVPDRYAASDPAALPAPRVPTTVFHGRADSVVPIELSRRYVQRVQGAPGSSVQLVEPGCGHFELIDPAPDHPFPLIREKTSGF